MQVLLEVAALWIVKLRFPPAVVVVDPADELPGVAAVFLKSGAKSERTLTLTLTLTLILALTLALTLALALTLTRRHQHHHHGRRAAPCLRRGDAVRHGALPNP